MNEKSNIMNTSNARPAVWCWYWTKSKSRRWMSYVRDCPVGISWIFLFFRFFIAPETFSRMLGVEGSEWKIFSIDDNFVTVLREHATHVDGFTACGTFSLVYQHSKFKNGRWVERHRFQFPVWITSAGGNSTKGVHFRNGNPNRRRCSL